MECRPRSCIAAPTRANSRPASRKTCGSRSLDHTERRNTMAISTQTMTPEQMKSVVFEYFKRFDRGGDVLALFAEDADVYFPKWGVARGKAEIARCFGDVAHLFTSIL